MKAVTIALLLAVVTLAGCATVATMLDEWAGVEYEQTN